MIKCAVTALAYMVYSFPVLLKPCNESVCLFFFPLQRLKNSEQTVIGQTGKSDKREETFNAPESIKKNLQFYPINYPQPSSPISHLI